MASGSRFSSAQWNDDGRGVPGGGEHARRAGILAVVEHRAEGEHDAPGEARDRHRRAEDAVADLARGGDALRTGGGDHDRDLDRPRGAVAVRLQHLDHAALPLDLLAAQERAQDTHVLDAHVDHLSGRCPIVRRPVKPEPTATATRSGPAIDTSVAIAAAFTIGWRRLGTSTPGPRPMRGRPLGRAAELHPDVGIERRRVVEPGARVAELLGDARVLVALVGGAKAQDSVRDVAMGRGVPHDQPSPPAPRVRWPGALLREQRG